MGHWLRLHVLSVSRIFMSSFIAMAKLTGIGTYDFYDLFAMAINELMNMHGTLKTL